jgi:hypothetical protein
VLTITNDGGPRLETLATGFHRWALRGGASAEAFRALVASGIDWLLRSERAGSASPLEVSRTVPRGLPVTFRWVAASPPDSLRVRLDDGTATWTTLLHLGPDGSAELTLEPGIYRWTAEPPGLSGVAAVEAYSDEFVPAPVALPEGTGGTRAGTGATQYLRERWWVFLLAIVALVMEWAWRQRRGLP